MWNSEKQEWHISPMHIEPEQLVAQIHTLFRHDLAAENDFLRAENRVLRKLHPDKLPRLTERDRRMLVKYGMRIKDRLADIISKAIERHHNQQRPHQGLGNNIPLGYEYPDRPAPPNEIKCDSALGGLLKHYYVDTCHGRSEKAA